MENILRELWNGNLAPCEMRDRRQGEIEELIELVRRNKEDILRHADVVNREAVEKLEDCHSELEYIYSEEAFIKGFSLGVRLVFEAMFAERK